MLSQKCQTTTKPETRQRKLLMMSRFKKQQLKLLRIEEEVKPVKAKPEATAKAKPKTKKRKSQ